MTAWLTALGARQVSAARAARNDDDGDYRIQQAFYGTEERHVDVTQRLRELARADQRFLLGNDTFGVDPDRGRVKVLRIVARSPSGRVRTFEYTEGSWVDGAQFGGWRRGDWGDDGSQGPGWGDRPGYQDGGDGEFRILRAHYGTEQRHVDVTDRLRELAARDARFRLGNDTFGVDPDRGRVKTLRIHARRSGGPARIFEYIEGSWVDGAQFSGWGGGRWEQDSGWRGGWNGEGRGGGSLRIVSAEYGSGRRQRQIGARLQGLVINGRLELTVSNSMAGGDPAPGQVKQLSIRYTVNGREQRRVVQEGERLSLP